MLKLRFIFIHIVSYLTIVLPIMAFSIMAYLILPIPAIKLTIGSIAGIYSVITFAIYAYGFVVMFRELKYVGEFISMEAQTHEPDVQEFVDFLEANEFKYFGVLENGRSAKKSYESLVFVSPTRTINAQITRIDPREKLFLSFSTYWDGTHFVGTFLNPDEGADLSVRRGENHLTMRAHAPLDEIYRMHTDSVKEFHARLGQAQPLSSPQQLIDWETEAKAINVLDEASAGANMLAPRLMALGILTQSIAVLVIVPLIYFGFVSLPVDFAFYRLILLLILMGLLMRFVYPRLMKDVDPKEKTKNKSIDEEIEDLLDDMN